MEWYKCRPRKLLDACEGLGTAALVSTYRTVIDRIYECDGPISNDPVSIGRYAGLRPSHAAKAIGELIERKRLKLTTDGRLDLLPFSGRKPLPQALRRAVYEKFGLTCLYCGTSDGPIELDHIHPVVRGGSDDLENLRPACRACNRSKGSKTLEEWLR